MKRIHFNLDSTVNYGDLQDQIARSVQDELAGNTWSEGVQAFDPECLNVSMFIREEGHVFLGHSLADRNYLWMQDGDGKRLLNRYQAALVPGKWMKDRLLQSPSIRLGPGQIYCVGSPRVDVLRRRQREIRDAVARSSRLKVLWAPTHSKQKGGSSISSHPDFEAYLPRIAEEFDVTAIPHPRHRKQKHAIVDELVGADVVITDSSSLIYEAWALGKPVVFPSWLLADRILAKAPGTAEAHIHRLRIGYHPGDIDQMLEILRNGPSIGDDVHDFMDDYLDNYREGNASKKVAQILTSLAQDNPHASTVAIQKKFDALFQAFASAGPDDIAAKSARSSIQLLQLQLLNNRYNDFLDTQLSMKELLPAGASLKKDIARLAVEAAFMRTDPVAAEEAISALRDLDSVSANGYQAKLLLISGKPLEAFHLAVEHARQEGDVFYSMQIVVEAFIRLGRREMAWAAQEKFVRTHRGAEDLVGLAALCRTPDDFDMFQQVADACLARKPRLIDEYLFVDATVRAALQTGNALAARETLSGFLLKVLQDKTLLGGLRKSASRGHPHPYSSRPQWLISYESLPPENIQHTGVQHELVVSEASRLLAQCDCHAFLIAETLQAWVSEDPRSHARDHVKFGILGETAYRDARRALSDAPAFSELPGENDAWSMPFKHVSGPILSLHLHVDDAGHRVYRDGGMELKAPVFAITAASRGNDRVNIPSLSAPGSAGTRQSGLEDSGAHAGHAARLVDPDRHCVALYRDFLNALVGDDQQRIGVLASALKEHGAPEIDILLTTEGKYLPGDLADRMSNARYLLHIGDGPDAAFHIDLWLDYCLAVDPSLLIAIRSKALFDLLAISRPDLPAIYVKEGLNAEWLVSSCTSLCGVLYVSNTGNTIHFLRFPHLRHIFLGHGDSEKTASCHKFFRTYDEVWTAGRAHIDRFRNSGLDFSSLRFRIVGRPTLRPLLESRQQHEVKGRFLYLPTWEGFQAEQNYSSVEMSSEFIPAVLSLTGKSADIKLHPLTGTRSRKRVPMRHWSEAGADPAPSSISLLDKAAPVSRLMANSDFLVSDISSVVTDYLCTGRPIFLFIPRNRDIRMSSSGMSLDSYSYTFSGKSELLSLVERVIVDGDDYLREARGEALRFYIDIDRTENMQFERELENVIHESGIQVPRADFRPAPTPSLAAHGRSRNLVVGHRGAKASIAENSLAGFRKAAKLGIDGIELDVHLSADGIPVVIHDPFLDRTTDASGAIGLLPIDAIRRARLKDSDETIPTLDEALGVLSGSTAQLHIEIKNNHLGVAYEGLVAKVLDAIDRFGVRERAMLTCFSADVLEAIRHADAAIPLLASINYKSAEMLGGLRAALQRFSRIPGCVVSLERGLMKAMPDPPLVPLQSTGVWVVNDEKELEFWFAQGIQMITTDKPDLALKVRNRMENGQ